MALASCGFEAERVLPHVHHTSADCASWASWYGVDMVIEFGPRRGLGVVVLFATAQLGAAQAQTRSDRFGGRVVDALLAPTPGAEVWLTDELGRVQRRGRCDSTGVFTLTVPLVHTGLWLCASAPGKVRLRRRVLPGWDAHTSLRLWDAATVKGRIVDGRGEPIAGAHVAATFGRSWNYFDATAATATSATDGRFEIVGVSLGMIDFRVIGDGLRFASKCIKVEGDTEVELVIERKQEREFELSFTGLTDSDRAATCLRLSCQGPQRRVFLADRWPITASPVADWVRGMPAGFTVVIAPLHPALAFEPSTVISPGSTALQVVASPRPRQRIRAVDDAGAPTPEQRLWMSDDRGASDAAVTDADGVATLPSPVGAGGKARLAVLPGPYVLRDGDPRHHVVKTVVIAPDAELSVVLTKARHVRAVVRDHTDAAVDGVMVTAYSATSDWLGHSVSRYDGVVEFWLPAQPEGAHFEASGPHGEASRAIAELGRDVDLGVLRLEPPAEVVGVVRYADGKLAAGAQVVAVVDGRHESEVLTDRQGRFRIGGVPAGSLVVTAQHDDLEATVEVEVAAGKVVRRELELPAKRAAK